MVHESNYTLKRIIDSFTETPGKRRPAERMKARTITWTMLIMLVASILLPTINMAHGTITSLNQTQTVAQGTSDGLELTMMLEKTVYTLGEPISITLSISNISNQTITFGMSYWNDYDFHVYNDSKDIYWYSINEVGALIPDVIWDITLNPGDSTSWTLVWQQTDFASEPVCPGIYYIVGVVGPPFFYKENPTLETTPLQITIGWTLSFRDWRYMGLLHFLEREDPNLTSTMVSSEPPVFLISEKT